jgi:CubicO group peptidase (beta-lactamase class C family)
VERDMTAAAVGFVPAACKLAPNPKGRQSMRASHLRTAVATILALGLSAPAHADRADDFVRAFMAKTHAPGVALAVIRNGKIAKASTYGYANLEWHQPLTRNSPFWLDSLTKLFTAVGVMRLAEEGKLSLDDPITKYLADTPSDWRPVTVRHLLTHSSGIKDDYWQVYRGSPLLNYDEKDIYAYALKQPLQFKPGDQFSYDNEGYYLLGLIIAKAAGEPYTKWMTEHVLKPARMKTARMYDPAEIIPQMVSSYELNHGRVVHNRSDILSDRGEAIAGWGIYASLDDMIAFDSALRGGRLISKESLNKMWANARLNSGYPAQSGIGFEEVSYPRGHRKAHKGGQAGVDYSIFPDDSVSVILLTNMEASAWGNGNRGVAIASIFDPAIQPLSLLQPQADPDPTRTGRIRQALSDIASGVSPSPLITSSMNAGIDPDFRAQTKQLLAGMSGFQYLGCDRASTTDPYGAVSYCYYRTKIPPGTLDLQFGFSPEGKLASGNGQLE